ncbi:MAG TPA: helix-turn-helix transcriptional regulator [Roseococcus sp.]|jgi:transcriptional regulator with XRE-family HTH domain|nr:helix-turn-helix transcriptional regulator [Roseococcus sp.]
MRHGVRLPVGGGGKVEAIGHSCPAPRLLGLAGLTQAALAKAAELSQPYLAQIENGRRGGDVHVLARLAKALSVRIEDLIDTDAA